MTTQRPGSAEIHVWMWKLTGERNTLAELEATLSDHDWQRVRRFHAHRQARRFVARRGVMRRILGAYLGSAPQAVQIEYGSQGKPALAGEQSSLLQFSLSDSDELAALAVTAGHPVGLDIERLRPLPDAAALAKQAFDAGEAAFLSRAAADERARIFFQLWTRREAVAKVDGRGLVCAPHLPAAEERVEIPHIQRGGPFHPQFNDLRFHRLALPAGFVGALATRNRVSWISHRFCLPDLTPLPFSAFTPR